MEREFIPYEQAFVIRQLGFKEECLGLWQNLKSGKYLVVDDEYDRKYDVPVLGADIGAPLYQQAFRWFRENHGLHGIPREWTLDKFSYEIKSNREGSMTFEVYGGYPLIFKTYEEAELACLNRLIEILKNK